MFDFDDYKSFKDMVHGYIQIPKLFVDNIIDTPLFQRLRFIEQTGMRQVYPSARHDRFVHSLGTFFLGTKAVDALLRNFKDSVYWNIYSDDRREIFWAKNKVLFLIACLLHDIGHAPFSHSLEHLYIYGKNNEKREIDSLLQKHFPDGMNDEFYITKTKKLIPQEHEIISAIIVMDKYRENVSRILNSLNEKEYPNENYALLSEHAVVPKVIDSSDINNDLSFIARMITGITYKGFEPEKQIRNCFISLLNGTTFDVDKLDYIIRDSKMSGLNNVQLDIDRLLNSLYIIPVTKFVNYLNTEDNKTLDLDDIILGLYTDGINKANLKSSHFQGNLSIKQGTVSIGENSKIGSLTGKLYIKQAEFTEHSYILENGNEVETDKSYFIRRLQIYKNETETDVGLKNAEPVKKFEFSCKIKEEDGEKAVKIRNFIGEINIKKGIFRMSSAAKLNGKLYGGFAKVEILGDCLEKYKKIPDSKVFNSFQIGFKKSAISVIQNISIARNYLYLWIYSHHKVVYYANYLIPELLNLAAKIMGIAAHDYISYYTIQDTDDASIVSLFKEAWEKANKITTPDKHQKKYIELYSEYKTRKYKKSLFKTLADYDLFFIDFTTDEKDKLKIKLTHGIGTEQKPYDYIETDFHTKYGIENLMWIDANLSIKEVEPGKVFIKFGENEFYTMEQINILSINNAAKKDNPYFYVYYSFSKKDKESNYKFEKIEEFKKKLKELFRNKLTETGSI